jgi:hypothetical protein
VSGLGTRKGAPTDPGATVGPVAKRYERGVAMRRNRVLLLTAIAAMFIFVAGAAAYSNGVWLTTRNSAVRDLPRRFQNIGAVTCQPDRSSATQVFVQTRFWQRFWCSGETRDGISFRLRFVVTGKCHTCWTIGNLTGTGARQLRGRLTAG